jgi:hypothetical protein
VFLSDFRKSKGSKAFSLLLAFLKDKKSKYATPNLNLNRDKRLISLLLFIDFRKAFDLVDSRKLLRKLFHYGFDNSAINLIANYFTDLISIKLTTRSSLGWVVIFSF